MNLPDAEQLRRDPRFRAARTRWIINALFAWTSVFGFLAAATWIILALIGRGTWSTAAWLVAGSLFAAYVAREYRRAAAKAIATAVGLEGVPLEMERWGHPRIAPHAVARANAWHEQRYGGKSPDELAALAREDDAKRRELEESRLGAEIRRSRLTTSSCMERRRPTGDRSGGRML